MPAVVYYIILKHTCQLRSCGDKCFQHNNLNLQNEKSAQNFDYTEFNCNDFLDYCFLGQPILH